MRFPLPLFIPEDFYGFLRWKRAGGASTIVVWPKVGVPWEPIACLLELWKWLWPNRCFQVYILQEIFLYFNHAYVDTTLPMTLSQTYSMQVNLSDNETNNNGLGIMLLLLSRSVAQLCLTLWGPVDCNTPGFPVLPSPGVCSNSRPLSRWCYPTISSSFAPFSSCLQSFPASGSFLMSWLFISGEQSTLLNLSGSNTGNPSDQF